MSEESDEDAVVAWFEAMAEIPAEIHKKVALALHTENPVILRILAKEPAWRVRRNVAANKATPVETVKTLLTDVCPEVQVAALCSTKVTYTMLLEIQEQISEEVWVRVKFWKLTPQTYPFIG